MEYRETPNQVLRNQLQKLGEPEKGTVMDTPAREAGGKPRCLRRQARDASRRREGQEVMRRWKMTSRLSSGADKAAFPEDGAEEAVGAEDGKTRGNREPS